ncbi:MAG TPA: efflux RND transporter permease subunit [Terracidiphilus sp.]|jgi:multidrug efflux pump|nr:efflux RND transporter permease subunit [Terracidiphilus sp.]
MHLSAPFIQRPVATSLLSLALLMAGSVAYSLLPVASLPDVDFPVIGVSAGLPGASPETMASAVATPLERQFGRIAGVNQMTSSSSLGSASVALQFDMSRNIDAAARDVQASINAARSQLPSYLPQNPSYRKANPADAPILILTLTSDVVKKPEIYDMADSILAQKIAQIQGVGQVFVGGTSQPAVRVELNPMQLANDGVGLEAVRTALANANANRPKGAFQDPDHRWAIDDNDQIFKASDYAPIIAGYNPQTGAAVRVEDLGTVTDSVADLHTAGVGGINPIHGPPGQLKSAVLLVIFKMPGANVISTVDSVLSELPRLQSEIPPTIKIDVAVDRTTTIRASVHDVEISLIISVVLVVLVVFLFLREVWATIIPSVAVPLSLVGTFGVMYILGYSIDNLSLMALTISTGFVVDDAIVVIENITRYLELGEEPFEAAMKGSREIGFTVLSMSTSLIAVFIPILMMGGIVGKLFREFAVTLSVAIAVSLLVSLTTTPMLCAKFLKSHDRRRHGAIYRATERAFNWLHAEYALTLKWVLRHQWPMLLIVVGTVVLNGFLFVIVPKGFFPQQDTGRLGGSTRAAQDISFDAMQAKQSELAQMVLNDPAVMSVTAFVGGNGPGGGGTNVGRMFISLKPASQRKGADGKAVTGDMVVNRLRNKLTSVPGATLFLQVQQEFQIGGRGSDAQYQYTLSDENLNELNSWAPQLLARMRSMPELRDASTDQQNQGLAANLVIDRDTASRLGISATAIDNVLYDAFGQREVSTMYTGLNQYFVVMEVDPKYQLSPDALNDIYVKAGTTLGATTSMPATVTATASTAPPAAAAPAVSAITSTSGATALFPTLAGNLAVSSTASGASSSSTTTTPSVSTTGTAAQVDPVLGGTLTGITSAALGGTATTSAAATAAASISTAATASAGGAMVPLSAIAHYESQRTSLAVNHQGQYPAVTLTFNLAPNVALGQAVTALENAQRDLGMPSAIHASFQGTAQAFQDSLKNEPYLILAALVAVYIVLGILYESLIHPFTILSTLPPAGVGAILALLLTGTDLSIIALIGILLLIGIVKKNAIMMIDFALQAERDQGLPPEEAIYQACLLRFRPIMMTTMAALFGGLPLAIGMGVGSELRQPLGITIVGGLIVSQALTLLTTPVVYLFFDKLQWKVMKLHKIGEELEGQGVQAD